MPNYEREPLDEFEEVRGVFYGGYGQVGHQFVITNRRLLMAPIKLIKNVANDTSLKASSYVAGQLGMPGADLVGEILQSYAPFDPLTIWLRHIIDVRAGSDGGLLKPPQLVFTTNTEDVESIGVVKGMWTASGAPANRGVRDQMVAILTQAAADANRRLRRDWPSRSRVIVGRSVSSPRHRWLRLRAPTAVEDPPRTLEEPVAGTSCQRHRLDGVQF